MGDGLGTTVQTWSCGEPAPAGNFDLEFGSMMIFFSLQTPTPTPLTLRTVVNEYKYNLPEYPLVLCGFAQAKSPKSLKRQTSARLMGAMVPIHLKTSLFV